MPERIHISTWHSSINLLISIQSTVEPFQYVYFMAIFILHNWPNDVNKCIQPGTKKIFNYSCTFRQISHHNSAPDHFGDPARFHSF